MLCFIKPILFISLFLLPLTASSPTTVSILEKRAINCRELNIQVAITAANIQVPSAGLKYLLQPLNVLASVILTLFKTTTSGTYTIRGRYCEPIVDFIPRRNTIQLLAHPATYNRDYWSGGGYPGKGFDGERYDYVSYAARQGYATFAFDQIGNGNSTHPNGITVVQCPAEAEVIYQLVLKLKSGSKPFPRSFKKVVLVGCSLGSIIANNLHRSHPNIVDATILGGFTKFWLAAVPGFVTSALLLPALDAGVGYLRASNPKGTEFLLFYGRDKYYNGTFIDRDYVNRGTVTVGEGVSGSAGIGIATQHLTPVFVITGQQDVLFCGTTAILGTGPGNCKRNNILADTKSLYPKADYEWYALENTGHCWHHQYSAQEGFKASHAWLARKGF